MVSGTTLVIIGYIVIAGGALVGGFLTWYGTDKNSQETSQRHTDEIKALNDKITTLNNELKAQAEENTQEIKDLLERVATQIQAAKAPELNADYPPPGGYQVFGTLNQQIIPSSEPSTPEIKINWSTAKVVSITADFVKIMLPDVTLPGNIFLQRLTVGLSNHVGSISSGDFVILGWSSYVEILQSDENIIIAVVGYKYQGD